MKIENEIEKLNRRVNLLENQNNRFKNLLNSAIAITKQSVSRTSIQKDETEFLAETIQLIEAEKSQLQDDLVNLKRSEREVSVQRLEQEINNIKNKVNALLVQSDKNAKDLNQLKLEHNEFKFLLTQPDSNADWLKNILQLDSTVTENASLALLEQRYSLQQKIYTLEKKKTELLSAIDDFTSPNNVRDAANTSEINLTLYHTIDDEAKKEYEDLHFKVLDLEQERSELLSQLQLILERSRKEIADEYCQLQKKILEIETEKAELKLTLKNMGTHPGNSGVELVDGETNLQDTEESEIVDKILNAFKNSPASSSQSVTKRDHPPSNGQKGDYCIIS